jgi:Flp pilus assembly protein TadD
MKPHPVTVGFSTRAAGKPPTLARPVQAKESMLRTRGTILLRAVLGGALLTSPVAADAQGPDMPPEPAVTYHVPSDPGELLKVDEPMRRFFGARLQAHPDRADQLRTLLDAIFRPDGLGFTYDRSSTFDARETFRQRRGSCVGFSFLVVAIAREFGFDASFQDVTTPIRWDRIDKLVISVRHMNVRVNLGRDYYLIDLQPDIVAVARENNMRVISDQRAFADFYGTVGFFELLRGQPKEAMRCMILATATDPNSPYAWANQAALHSHGGDLGRARACFERALKVDPRNLFALEGYVGVLQRLGTREDLRIAAKYARRAQSVRDHNPYYQHRLAERAQTHGDWAAAEKFLRRAIALKDDDPEFHEQRVQVLRQLGREADARRATRKLEKLQRRQAADRVTHAP